MLTVVSSYEQLTMLADEFWTWRAATQPTSGDDIPRIERRADWLPDWSPDAVEQRRQRLSSFEARWRDLGASTWPVAEQVDYRLIGSAVARVRWELDVLQSWQRNPNFYMLQTLGPVFERLLLPAPDPRVLTRLARRIPETVDAARTNLAQQAVAPFAQLAISALQDVRGKLHRVCAALPGASDDLAESFTRASDALESFAEWLQQRLKSMPDRTPIGREVYAAFLRDVALISMTPEQVAAAGQQELERSIAFETFEQQRNHALPPLPLPSSQQEQLQNHERAEQRVRDFCEQHDVLTFPDWLRHYRNKPQPAYLAPLRGLGVTNDLTSPTRLDQDGVHFIPEPTPNLPYFLPGLGTRSANADRPRRRPLLPAGALVGA